MSKLKKKRLITHKQLESAVVKVSQEWSSVFNLNIVVYYEEDKSPYNTAQATYRLADRKSYLGANKKLLYVVNFGEWLENRITQYGTRFFEGEVSGTLNPEIIHWLWTGNTKEERKGLTPFTQAQKKQHLKDLYNDINVIGSKMLIREEESYQYNKGLE